jgi:hypothetical protein
VAELNEAWAAISVRQLDLRHKRCSDGERPNHFNGQGGT